MPDDRDPPRRKGSMGDSQRATAGRKYRAITPLRGVPSDFGDEPTPPPVPLEIDATMSLDEQVAALRGSVNEQARATARTWGMRDAPDRLDRIDTKQDIASREISELGALIREFLMPAVKASQSRIDLLLQHHEANRVRVEVFHDREWPAAMKALEGMTERLCRVERGQERQEHEMRGMSDRLNANHGALAQRVEQVEKMETRIAMLERAKRDGEVEVTAIAKSVSRKSTGVAGIIAVVVSAITAAASHFIK